MSGPGGREAWRDKGINTCKEGWMDARMDVQKGDGNGWKDKNNEREREQNRVKDKEIIIAWLGFKIVKSEVKKSGGMNESKSEGGELKDVGDRWGGDGVGVDEWKTSALEFRVRLE